MISIQFKSKVKSQSFIKERKFKDICSDNNRYNEPTDRQKLNIVGLLSYEIWCDHIIFLTYKTVIKNKFSANYVKE